MAEATKAPRVSVKDRILLILADNEDGLTTVEVVRTLGHKQQGRTFKTIKSLREDDKLVRTAEVKRDPDKGAKSKVHTLTSKGEKYVTKLREGSTEEPVDPVDPNAPVVDHREGEGGDGKTDWPEGEA